MVDEVYANYIKNKENDKQLPDNIFYLVLAHSLVILGMFYKYPAFKTEKEIRCLYYSPVNADDPIFEPEDIKFRKKEILLHLTLKFRHQIYICLIKID